ncbi:MAG: Bis(5'-nucleosyl)-tetraphosphatase, symmetrical [Paracidovorax wautersii]|uniref:bis(5'-nucleosyl)-tetraphosphatase (symmetrical) n=1 Tax=Paracidovorax wautersii TaxID=1177982 RepID=A0A7V8FNF8_9BURK|nr:MAG: Bis(5'-nucleosyl)-tetraphosphatase, symmetrical [Paracidovorax wautersii]
MALYCIGDIQGCDAPLGRLLADLDFSPSRDTLYVLGDLVNRGPASAAVLRRFMALDGAAHCLLGNHDLHLLAMAHGIRPAHRHDTLTHLLDAPDREPMLQWLRHQRLALHAHGVLMVHAGVLPAWTVDQTLALAGEVEAALQAPSFVDFLRHMYGNEPAAWDDDLQGADRLRVVVNALTRLRFCTPQGVMDFDAKEGLDTAPAGCVPWFDVPGRRTAGDTIAFGHWSTLGWQPQRQDILSLDTGCVWGGCLSAAEISAGGQLLRLVQTRCEQAQKPGR